MIRMNPAHDTVNPPGSVQPAHAEISLKEAIRRYEADNKTDELYASYLNGYNEGYMDGYCRALRIGKDQLVSLGHIDPSSEAAR